MFFSLLNTKTNRKFTLFFTFIIFAVVYLLATSDNWQYKNYFPFVNLQNNLLLTVSCKTSDTIDTLTYIIKPTNILIRNKSKYGIYQERDGKLLFSLDLKNRSLISWQSNIPFFKEFDKSNQMYTITKLSLPILEKSQWQDKHLGIIHEYKNLEDSLFIFGKMVKSYTVVSYLSKTAKQVINKKFPQDTLSSCSLREYYCQEFGWLKSEFPDGITYELIHLDTLFWFQRIPRLFNIGVR